MNNMDDTDRKLLSLLRKNARMPVVNLAKELRVSRATVQNRISKLEREGIILGYTVKLKENAYQNVVKVIMSISVVAKDENKVLEQLHRFPEILSLHHTNGHWGSNR